MLSDPQMELLQAVRDDTRPRLDIMELEAVASAIDEIAALRQFREAALSALGEHPDTEQIDIAQRISDIRDEGRAHFHALTKMGEQITSLTAERDQLLAASNDALKRVKELEDDVVELLADAFHEIASEDGGGVMKGWWCSNGRSTAVGYGDRLVEMGMYERSPSGHGRVQWYRPISDAISGRAAQRSTPAPSAACDRGRTGDA